MTSGGQSWGMIFLCGGTYFAHATYSSIYIFGDSVSSTATNAVEGTSQTNWYYGKRYSNGRTWVEVLAQRQGLSANSLTTNVWNYSSNNFSFYGNFSPLMVTNVLNFTAPPNASNCLVVVWVCDADFVGDVQNFLPGLNLAPPAGTNLVSWTIAINQHLTNHFRAITNLYAKGIRTIVAPNAVDINLAPNFNTAPAGYRNFVRQQIIAFNTNYAAMVSRIEKQYLGLNIVVPDFFSVLDAAVTNASAYGLTNVLNGGYTTYALQSGLTNLNGAGASYVFWDYISPTAKLSEVFADTAQQLLSPPVFSGMTSVNASNRIDITNAPVGMNGTILFATNLSQTVWLTNSTFTATNVSQSVFVNPTNSIRFYSLKFPWQWSWP
jgi:phospholipase/lecithinase/hemolysin